MSLRINSLYLTTGALLRLAISVLSIPLLVRLLGLERYGIWAVLTSLSMLGGLLELGLTSAVTKKISEYYAHKDWPGVNQNLSMSLLLMTILGSLAFAGLFFTAPYLSNLFFRSSPYRGDAQISLTILAGLLFLYFWQHWLTAVQGGLMRYDLQAAIETMVSLVLTLGILLIAANSKWLSWLAVWSVFVTACGLLAHIIVLRRLLSKNEIHFQYSWKTAKLLIRFGFIQWVSNLGSSLFGYVDRIIVNYFLGSSAAGIYAAITSVVAKINQLSAMPLQALLSWVSAAKALSQQFRVQQIFIRATRVNGLVVFLIAAPIMFWSRPITLLLIGSSYPLDVPHLLRLLALVYGLYSLAGAGFYTAIGIGYPETNAIVGIVGGLLACIALVILTPGFGLLGAAWANALYILVVLINWKVRSLINLDKKEYLTHFIPSVIALLACWFVSWFVDSLSWTILFKAMIFFVFGGAASVFVGSWRFLKDVASMPLDMIKKRKSGIVD